MRAHTPRSQLPLQLAAAITLLVTGIALRYPLLQFHGPRTQDAFNSFVFHYLGAYSDIASLYFRDAMWTHPVPYVDNHLEYPVGMGLLIWVLNIATGFVPYMLVTALAMVGGALVGVWLLSRMRDANPWILALSPALAAYVLLNWDLLCVVPMLCAIEAYDRDRDVRGAAWLSVAIWTKFFPLLLVPVILSHRLLAKRYRDVARTVVVVGVASIVVNAPVAIAHGRRGFHIRRGWQEFFAYSSARGPELNFWSFVGKLHLSVAQINFGSAMLMVFGMSCVLVALWRARGTDPSTAPRWRYAFLAIVAWFFFVNKVYSPQYSVWIVVLLAVCNAPVALAAAFLAIDVIYFLASFICLQMGAIHHDASDWFFNQALYPSMVVREVLLCAVALWSLSRVLRGTSRVPTPSPALG